MLRANIGLSRKVSRDFQSTGYTVNLDGEIPFPTDDVEGVMEKVRELFNLAQEALDREIDRDQGEAAMGRREEDPPPPTPAARVPRNGKSSAAVPTAPTEPASRNGNGHAGAGRSQEELATNKQIQFILTMGKRFKLSTPQLEGRVVQIVGRQCGIYDLTKKEAGKVLDQLTNGQPSSQPA